MHVYMTCTCTMYMYSGSKVTVFYLKKTLFIAASTKPIIGDKWKKQKIDLARIRTWNLLIRSQTRYPLRHKALHVSEVCHDYYSL